jgi:hypothetical protein
MAHNVNVNGEWHQIERGRATALDSIPSDQCSGDACGVVSLDWLGVGQGYRVSNSGKERVRVRIRWVFGFQCQDWTNIELNPGQSQNYLNGGYCQPVEANYI